MASYSPEIQADEAAEQEARILEQVRLGDRLAFGALARKYQDQLFNAVVHVTGCHAEAEDVVQEALFKALTQLSTFEGKCSFYTWLYRIAVNVALTRKRRQRLEVSLEPGKLVQSRALPASGEDPSARLQRREDAWRLRRAMGTLSETSRAILVLREFEDCSYETISEILELPVGTVRSRLYRARMQLKTALDEAG